MQKLFFLLLSIQRTETLKIDNPLKKFKELIWLSLSYDKRSAQLQSIQRLIEWELTRN